MIGPLWPIKRRRHREASLPLVSLLILVISTIFFRRLPPISYDGAFFLLPHLSHSHLQSLSLKLIISLSLFDNLNPSPITQLWPSVPCTCRASKLIRGWLAKAQLSYHRNADVKPERGRVRLSFLHGGGTVVFGHFWQRFWVSTSLSQPPLQNSTLHSRRKCPDHRHIFFVRNGKTLPVYPSQTKLYFEVTISNPYSWLKMISNSI